ncbi:TlpA family protein disulfide reductase [Pontibacter sp. MBLB2868]|uniref:TlpA family protein disulfide reductase n=1 Tax=Pontibacter sp. MBLB2868 TaxID=3451555 RepID=UPI003F7515DA
MKPKKWLPGPPFPFYCLLLPWLIALLMGFVGAPERHQHLPLPELAPGQPLPDVQLTGMFNYPKTTARLSDFRGKLVLLDFWATWCGACLVNMPKLEKLQQAFGDSIQILAVTSQSREEVERFRKKNKLLQSYSLPIVTGDTELKRLFPHKLLPGIATVYCRLFSGSHRFVKEEVFKLAGCQVA